MYGFDEFGQKVFPWSQQDSQSSRHPSHLQKLPLQSICTWTTGGCVPLSLIGDWLRQTSVFKINGSKDWDSSVSAFFHNDVSKIRYLVSVDAFFFTH